MFIHKIIKTLKVLKKCMLSNQNIDLATHLSLQDGFIFEGHIPAKYIAQFLSENHPNALGLSVPGMPLGSPGMEFDNRFTPYEVLILYKDGSSKVFAEVKN